MSKYYFRRTKSTQFKKIIINDCLIIKPKSILETPDIEEAKLTFIECDCHCKYSEAFNFNNFKKLKKLIANPCDFVHLNNDILENLELISIWDIDTDIQKKLWKK